MTEPVGALASGITLAGLFRICVNAFDIIKTCKEQERDLKNLTLRLNIERCRLYTWGEAMQLAQSDESGSPLNDFVEKHTVQETLEMIFQLLNDTQKFESRYGCRPCPDIGNADDTSTELEGPEDSPLTVLATSFSNFGIIADPKCQTVHKARWVIDDGKKFGFLMVELKDLVDGLQDITTPLVSGARLESMMRKAIRSIKDVDTLTLVAEVTEADHPDLSVTASNKADTVSTTPSTWRGIASWSKEVCASANVPVDITEELKEMDLTELRTRLLRNQTEQQHRQHEGDLPPLENPAHVKPLDNEMAQHEASQQAANQLPSWLQDHPPLGDGFSPQDLYERTYRATLEACAAEQAAKDAAAKAVPAKEEAPAEDESPEKKAPIMFHDAYQRTYKLPFELCISWRSMESMIVQVHQAFDAAELVVQRRYDLLGPSGEVIMPSVWESIIEPGWDISLKPWPESDIPPPLDDSVLTLDDILTRKKGGRKKSAGKSKASKGGFATWMSGGKSTKSISGSSSASGRTVANSKRRRR